MDGSSCGWGKMMGWYDGGDERYLQDWCWNRWFGVVDLGVTHLLVDVDVGLGLELQMVHYSIVGVEVDVVGV